MRAFACLLSLCLAVPGLATAQGKPVVVEFFTSQGCVTCPPADALFAEIAKQKNVVALALHVTYWDYLGWPDTFAKLYNDKRQKAYSNLMRQRTLFTPQMVIEGEDVLVGRDADTISERISAHQEGAASVTLAVERHGDQLTIDLAPVAEPVGDVDIQLVTYIPSADVAIGGGANAGQTVRYTNIVTGWSTVAQWDGASTAEVSLGAVPEGPIAVLVQSRGLGPILNAAMLD